MKKPICLIVTICILLSLCACTPSKGGELTRLNAEAEGTFSEEHLQNATYDAAYREFSYRFFRTVADADEGNLCLSPLSAYMAFSLCGYGSEGETATEFAATFGLTKEQAAEYCQSLYAHYMQRTYSDKNTRVGLANSLWLNLADASSVKTAYLTGATEYFDASIYRCDFSDGKTVDAINKWCADNTDGLIDKIVDKLDAGQLLALINALLVEAAWRVPYSSQATVKDVFRNADGSESTADYLPRKISCYYLGEDAKAFKMSLCDDFSFVGILPDEGVAIDAYCNSLTAEKIASLLGNATYGYDVYTRIPKYSLDYETDLTKVMKKMGLNAAFDARSANFKGIAEIPGRNLYVGTAKQKTHFELDEKGIKAAAITYIGMNASSAPISRPRLELYLNRPFVYLLVEESTDLPLFVGKIGSL